MDKTEILVNKYYDKLNNFAQHHFSFKNIVSSNEEHIKELLYDIVSNNYDHLLTDSIMDYSVYYGATATRLYELGKTEYEQIDMLAEYFRQVFKDYRCSHTFYYSYSSIIDDELKKVIVKALIRLDNVYKHFDYNHYRKYDLERIVLIVLSYYMINNRQDNIDELLNIFLNEPYRTLESLYMNAIKDQIGDSPLDQDCYLYDYVLARIRSNNKKEIK